MLIFVKKKKRVPFNASNYFSFELYSIADDENDKEIIFFHSRKLEQRVELPEWHIKGIFHFSNATYS